MKCGQSSFKQWRIERDNFMEDRQTFIFRLCYFKTNGKFYSSANISLEVQALGEEVKQPYMNDATAWVQKKLNIKAKLPGLSGTWDGYILVDCEQGFPCLMIPQSVRASGKVADAAKEYMKTANGVPVTPQWQGLVESVHSLEDLEG